MTQQNQPAQASFLAPVMRTMVVDGISVEMPDTAMQVVQRALAQLNDRVTKAEKQQLAEFDEFQKYKKKREEMEEEDKKAMAAKDGEIAALKKQVADAAITPAKLDELVRARVAVIAVGKKVLGDKLVVDGKTDADIRKQVVAAQLGDAAIVGKDDTYVQAAFDTLAVAVKDKDVLGDALGSNRPAPTNFNNQQRVTSDQAYESYIKDIEGAYKGTAKAA